MKFIVALLLFVAVAQATKQVRHATSPFAITGSYIVVLKPSMASTIGAHIEKLEAIKAATNDPSEITFRYNITDQFVGFAGKLSDNMLQIELAHPDVDYVEADQVVRAVDYVTQTKADWGLARTSAQKTWDKTQLNYKYDSTAGKGVNVYVLDTGIRVTHVDFEGRATTGATMFPNENNTDLNGHGTHCAGIIGGKTYGIAKKANLIAVKVLNAQGSGSLATVIGGVDWVTNQYQAKRTPSVASMSLGGGASEALDSSVVASINAGVAYSIAAGNDASDACRYSPAKVSEKSAAITVGSTDINDVSSSFSNFGKCVTLYAPGSSITSDWCTSNTATNTISGTSMACPHVSGVLALKLGKSGPQTPAALKTWITSVATMNVIKNFKPLNGGKNALLFAPYENL